MIETIKIKLEPEIFYARITVKRNEILLHDVTSIAYEMGARENKKFWGKRTIDIIFSSPNALKSNKKQLKKLANLTASYGEATTRFMSRNTDYKHIYRIGFNPDEYEVHTIF